MEILGKIAVAAAMFLVATGLFALIGLLMAFPVMWCWNGFAPSLLAVGEMNYWQAFSLFFLAICLRGQSTSSTS